MRIKFLLATVAACLLGVALAAAPAEAQPQRIRGTIASLNGQVLTVTTREGPQVKITLADNYTVRAVKTVDASAITTGSFVGIAAAPAPGGGWRALEVLLFPEAARGSGEGHYDWDLAPGSSMTNATVTAVVNSTNGHSVNLKYKDGAVDIAIPDGTPLVTPIGAERSDVKPGAAVLIGATKAADGSLTAASLTVEKDGVKPPM